MATPLPDPERLLEALVTQMKALTGPETGIVGIYTGGAWVAERLHRALGAKLPLGLLAVTLHRDDFGRIGLHPEQRRSHLPFDVEGRDIVLVDDVLHTGRTVRAALNELWDFGRPGRVRLAVLADRGGRQLPIAPDFCGGAVEVDPGEDLVLTNDSERLRLAAVRRPS